MDKKSYDLGWYASAFVHCSYLFLLAIITGVYISALFFFIAIVGSLMFLKHDSRKNIVLDDPNLKVNKFE